MILCKVAHTLLPLVALLAGTAKGEVTETVTYDWTVGREWISPDGFNRAALTTNYNGKLVGPKIRVKNGGRVIVNVMNDSDQPITIHFHGIHQKGFPWSDGVASGTQCGIPPGTSFVYNFVVNQSPGTYMWHGHYLATEGDGLHGVMIIDPADENDEVYAGLPKDELLLEVGDWYHLEAKNLVEGIAASPFHKNAKNVGTPPHWPGNPQNLLINGKALWKCPTDFTAFGMTYCDDFGLFESVGKNNDRIVGEQEVFNVLPGKRYLMRVVNLAVVQYMTVTVENHNLTVVAADGHPVKPFTVASLDINVAERYDVILETSGKPGTTYDIRVGTKFRSSFSGEAPPSVPRAYPGIGQPGPVQIAKLTYGSAESSDLEALPPLTPYGLVPVDHAAGFNFSDPLAFINYFNPFWVKGLNSLPEDMRGEAYETLMIDGYMWFDPADDRLKWPINNVVHQNDPSELPFLPLVSTGLGDETLQSKANNMWTLPKDKVIDMVFHNYGETWIPELGQIDEHPWHVHGFSFYVMGYGPGEYPGFQDALKAGMLNVEDPPYRDMVTTFPGIMPDGKVDLNLIEMPEIWKEEPWVYNFSGTNLTNDCYINDPRPNCKLAGKPYGWSMIRLKADNPGVWNIHCHLIWHLIMNMQGYIVISPEDIPPMTERYASELQEQCAAMGADQAMLDEVLVASGHEDLVSGKPASPTSTPGEGGMSAPVPAPTPSEGGSTVAPVPAPTPSEGGSTVAPAPADDETDAPTTAPDVSAALSIRGGSVPISAVAALVAIAATVFF